MNGFCLVFSVLDSPVTGLSSLDCNNVFCVRYRDPEYPNGFVFPARRLAGAKMPDRVLKPGDLDEESNRKYRPQIGEFSPIFFI